MAYNTVKGNVLGSVDQYGDQEIEGIKVFKNVLSASVFYDTDAQSPCATMKDVAITKIKGGRVGSVLTYGGGTTATAQHNIVFDGECLQVKNIVANNIAGRAHGLREIPSDQFRTPVKAAFINYGPGLTDIRETLQVNTGPGLSIDSDDELRVAITSKSGLSTGEAGLYVNPSSAPSITLHGQNLSDDDLMLVWDNSRSALHQTTLSNLYDRYIHLKMPKASGQNNEIQFKLNGGFSSTPKLTYDKNKETLTAGGTIATSDLNVENSLRTTGAVYHNIAKISEANYNVKDNDYTLLCDSVKHPVVVTLPPACNCRGRILIIKKLNSDKYKINSNIVTIRTEEGRIDIGDEITIKMNYASRTLQSDGANWWLIGAKGT
mgnify:CR=1 FL=1|tara:strand:- start:150 stop:1280 length:1131 start_codon:yes stop_codon:yes gene_type:complete